MSCVWTVRVIRADNVGRVDAVYRNLDVACSDAQARSHDHGVLAVAVTRFTVDEPGTRSSAALYVAGQKQAVPYVSDCRRFFS